jgi:hypothetical protein
MKKSSLLILLTGLSLGLLNPMQAMSQSASSAEPDKAKLLGDAAANSGASLLQKKQQAVGGTAFFNFLSSLIRGTLRE